VRLNTWSGHEKAPRVRRGLALLRNAVEYALDPLSLPAPAQRRRVHAHHAGDFLLLRPLHKQRFMEPLHLGELGEDRRLVRQHGI